MKELNMFKNNIVVSLIVLCVFAKNLVAYPPINLFRPSDRLLQTDPVPGQIFDITIGVEHALSIKGFRETEELLFDTIRNRKVRVNPLQVYQKKQNVTAALKGSRLGSEADLRVQACVHDDENSCLQFVRPTGCFEVPYNVLFNARAYFTHGVSLGVFLPYYEMRLTNVRWQAAHLSPVDRGISQKELEQLACKLGGLSLTGWTRKGIGDLLIQARWMQDFMQLNKPLLKNVRAQARLGVVTPTGKRRDEDKPLAFAFGNDGSWGLQFAGGLGLFFVPGIRLGLDAEFQYLFGNTRCRRVKTDCNQTSLLFFTKIPVFREYGLFQNFTVFIEGFTQTFSLRLAYNYLKQNESRDYPYSDKINSLLINNTTQDLQDWTAHSLIGMLKYRFGPFMPAHWPRPTITGWAKWGFNGKRALLADTIGFMLSVNF